MSNKFNDFAVEFGWWLSFKNKSSALIEYEDLAKIIDEKDIINERKLISGIFNLFGYETSWNDIQSHLVIFKLLDSYCIDVYSAEEIQKARKELYKLLDIE